MKESPPPLSKKLLHARHYLWFNYNYLFILKMRFGHVNQVNVVFKKEKSLPPISPTNILSPSVPLPPSLLLSLSTCLELPKSRIMVYSSVDLESSKLACKYWLNEYFKAVPSKMFQI